MLSHRLFSFCWVYPEGEVATAANSLLVTFELAPSGDGTVLRLTETGFRERGWEVAVLEEAYHEHGMGWDTYLPRLGPVRRAAGLHPMTVVVDDNLWSARSATPCGDACSTCSCRRAVARQPA